VNAIELEVMVENLDTGVGLVLDAFNTLREKTDDSTVAGVALAYARLPASGINRSVGRSGFVEVGNGVDVEIEEISVILCSHGDSLEFIGYFLVIHCCLF
jgi:hypothetical protein